jgi:integrase
MKSAKTAYNHFKKFCSSKNLTKISFENYDANMKAEFAKFLLAKGNSNNTIHAVQKRITRFLNHAKKIGLHNNDTHKAFNIPERVGSIKFLEWDEVKKLIDLEVEPGIENDARDLFVFCCLTAMRYSDVQNLKKMDIKEHRFNNLEGVQYAAHIRQIKTNKITVIPLLPESIAILKKYKNEKTDFALPQRANQSVNRILKILGRRARLNSLQELIVYRGEECIVTHEPKWKILSTHMGRRTFATMAANKGIPINIACSITGQSPEIMLHHYTGVVDSKKFEEVQKKMQF